MHLSWFGRPDCEAGALNSAALVNLLRRDVHSPRLVERRWTQLVSMGAERRILTASLGRLKRRG